MSMTTVGKIFSHSQPRFSVLAAACGAWLLAAGAASAQNTINFTGSKTPEGTVVSTQFGPAAFFISCPMAGMDDSAFYGSTGANLGNWATNTDMTVTATDRRRPPCLSLPPTRCCLAAQPCWVGWRTAAGPRWRLDPIR